MILSAIRGQPLFKRSSVDLAHPRDPALARLFGAASNTTAGVSVTPDSAQSATGVWACVDLIASSIASLPLHLYEREDDGGRNRKRDHPLYELMHDAPNPDQTAFEWREMMMGHLLLRGNAYSLMLASNAGRITALVPMHPDRVRPFWHKERVWYDYRDRNGVTRILSADEVLHIRGRPRDRLTGMSPIEEMRNVIGMSLAAEDYGATFFRNGAAPLGVLEHPGELGEEAAKQLRESWDEIHRGARNSHKVAVLEEGLEYKQIGIANRDAQFLETRRFQLEEQARIYRVPPPMIGILDRATFSNSEQQALFFEQHTIRPWLVRFEQACRQRLLSDRERATLYLEFDTAGLLRADTQARAQYYREMFMIGALSQNDIRRRENEERIEGGDRYYVPLNMVPTDMVDQLPQPSIDEPPDDDDPDDDRHHCPGHERRERQQVRETRSVAMRRRLRTSYARLFRDAAARVTAKEAKAIRGAVKRQLRHRSMADFLAWLDTFYGELGDFVRSAYAPAVESYAESVYSEVASELNGPDEMPADVEQFRGEVLGTLAVRHISSSHGQIREIAENSSPEEAPDLIEERVASWEERRPDSVARRESVQVGEAIAVAAMAALGVTVIRWATVGDNCPICSRMSGRTVEVKKSFLGAGESIVAGDETVFTTRRSVAHPPLHKGCDCMIVAETIL